MDINPVSLDSSNSSDDHFLDENPFGDAIGNSSVSDLGDFQIPSYNLGLSLFQNSSDVTSHGDFQMPSSYGVPPFSNPNHGQDFVPDSSPVINLNGLTLSPNPSLVPNQGGLNLDHGQGLVQTPLFDLTDDNHGVPDSFALNLDGFQAAQYNDIGNFVPNAPNPFGYGFVNSGDNNNGGVGFMNNPFAPSMEGLLQNPFSFHGFNPMMMTNVVSQSGLAMPYTNHHQLENFDTQISIHLDPFLRKRIVLNIPAPAPLPEIGLGRRMIPYSIELLETMQPPAPVAPAAPADTAADAPPPNPEQMDQDGGDGDNRPPEKIGLVFYFHEQLDKLLLSKDEPQERIVVARIDTPEVLEAIERDDPDLYERMYKTRDTRKRRNSPSPLDLPPEKRGGGGGFAGPSATGNNQFQLNPGINPAAGGGGATGGFYHL